MPPSDFRKDLVSHFILRLVFCKSEDDRRWFLTNECSLFKHRLDQLTQQQRKEFMARNGLAFEPVAVDERAEFRSFLVGLAGVSEQNLHATDFYKVPYSQALSLVSKREVYLRSGYAYVPLDRLVSTIVARFRMSLARALNEAYIMSGVVKSDSRLEPLLKGMKRQSNLGNDFSKGSNVDKLTLGNIDERAEKNMPLCMRRLHGGLRREHKLKHWGRLQYGLFIKGGGMELEDAIKFWESHFRKIMDHDAFQKNYSYSFRHMYGKEGKRTEYSPYSCMKIIMGSPPETGAYHGCPYRHMPENQLVALFGSMSIGGQDLQDILDRTKNQHWQLACQKHFEVTHPGYEKMAGVNQLDNVGSHPNAWLAASLSYETIKRGGALNAATPAPTNSNGVAVTPPAVAKEDSTVNAVQGFDAGTVSAVTPAGV